MSQVVPLSQQTVERAESYEEAFERAAADGLICPVEIAELRPQVRIVVVTAQDSNLAYVAGMAVLKGGVGAKRAHELLTQIDQQSGDSAA